MVEPLNALEALWVAWIVSWLVASLWSSRAETRPPLRQELLYRTLTLAAALLVFWRIAPGQAGQLWITERPVGWLLVVAAAAGFAFAWWARVHLGALWSGSVTRKADHHIVDTGPYGRVRHPIYTGLLASVGATALQQGTIFALAGLALAVIAFCTKARLEERFLGAELDAGAYDAYRRRVPMLVPFWPRMS